MSEILGRSELHRAVLEGETAMVRRLLADGAEADQPDERGFTPLHFAAQQGHAAEVALLLQAGANPNAPNDLGNPPLWLAIMAPSNRASMARDLMGQGADPEIKNHHGRTPMEIACGMGDPELLAILQPGEGS